MSDVDLGFAGRHDADHRIHRALAALSPGDELQVRARDDASWVLRDRAGSTVGRLARSFKPLPGMRCRSAKVFAVVAWNLDQSEAEYRSSMRCDDWEVAVPELVFEPDEG